MNKPRLLRSFDDGPKFRDDAIKMHIGGLWADAGELDDRKSRTINVLALELSKLEVSEENIKRISELVLNAAGFRSGLGPRLDRSTDHPKD